jgi:ribosomal protein L37AE/L43A
MEEKKVPKKIFCPKCGSKKMKMHVPQTSIWKCGKCGYQGPVFLEDGNFGKTSKNLEKMDKLSKKLLRGRRP